MNLTIPTAESQIRHAEWHAFQALLKEQAGDVSAAREHLDSAREWMAIAGIPGSGRLEATEICGMAARAKTGVID